jgi:hypothetical protein
MSKTRLDLRTHARVYLDEISPADWLDSQINRELNYAYSEVYSAIIEVYEDYYKEDATVGLVEDQQDYELPDDFWKLRRLEAKYDSDGDYVKATRYDFRQIKSPYDSSTFGDSSTPIYELSGNYIKLLPMPSETVTAGIRLSYIKTISEMDDDDDTIDIPFPDRYGRLIVIGAVAQLMRKGQQEEAVAAKYQDDFQIGLEKMKQELEDRILDGNKVVLDVLGENINFERTIATSILH